MKIQWIIWLLVMMLIFPEDLPAQVNVTGICRIEEGRIIFRLDRRWDQTFRWEVAENFNIDSLAVVKAFEGGTEFTLNGVKWQIRTIDENLVELSKQGADPEDTESIIGDVLILNDDWINTEAEYQRESVPYGINKFTLFNIFSYYKGVARFYLPKQFSAKTIYLAGTFNGWSTLQTPMTRTDSGWVVNVPLKPGKYLYKFIIDGKWFADPFNRQVESDPYGGLNSVIFCYNHRFYLNGFPNASAVYVAGSFNYWNDQELSMFRVRGGWVLYMYLREGTHAYKFIVDDQWIQDPANPIVRPDGAGHFNSFVGIGDPVIFRLNGFPDAKRVALAGNFNAWNPGELFLEKEPDGWQLSYNIAPGNYEYKFIIDGKWLIDPANPYVTGEGDYQNSFMAVKPNHTFVLKGFPNAYGVVVTGSFTGWNPEEYRMIRHHDQWIFPVFLKPGKYIYKYVVDGKWILDPDNEYWEDNDEGTGNSVLWINH